MLENKGEKSAPDRGHGQVIGGSVVWSGDGVKVEAAGEDAEKEREGS